MALQVHLLLSYTRDNSHNEYVVGFSMTMLLAHGALGWFDDLIFLGIAILFLVMMFIAWFRSRGDDFESSDLMPEEPQLDASESDSPERFRLD